MGHMQEFWRKHGPLDLKVKPPKVLQHDFVKSNPVSYVDALMAHHAFLPNEVSLHDDLKGCLFRRLTQTLERHIFTETLI